MGVSSDTPCTPYELEPLPVVVTVFSLMFWGLSLEISCRYSLATNLCSHHLRQSNYGGLQGFAHHSWCHVWFHVWEWMSRRCHSKKEQAPTSGCKCLILRVVPLGLEPRTPWLWVRCSNQLSYGTERTGVLCFCGAKLVSFFELCKYLGIFF